MPVAYFRVHGFRELQRAIRHAGPEADRVLNDAFRDIGESVRVEWESRFARRGRSEQKSAAGYRTRLRQKGVAVGQSKRKKTGKHPEYGALQQRYGMRVVIDMDRDIERRLERAIDKVGDHLGSAH